MEPYVKFFNTENGVEWMTGRHSGHLVNLETADPMPYYGLFKYVNGTSISYIILGGGPKTCA